MTNTLLTLDQQLNLVSRNLATQKINGNLITFKYHRRVMYDYLWKQYPELMECRGHTYDMNTGQIVLAAPRKTFNYLEDDCWVDVPMNTPVQAYKKYNGFMGTLNAQPSGYVFGTTGTTNSNYAEWFKLKFYDSSYANNFFPAYCTYLFEVMHEKDPHIVKEVPGVVLLGYRNNETGIYYPLISNYNEECISHYMRTNLGEMLELVKTVKHEGFMLYDNCGNACKLKSPYYVGKKKLMRAKDSFIAELWSGKGLDKIPATWHDAVHKLIDDFSQEYWMESPEQIRRFILENYE